MFDTKSLTAENFIEKVYEIIENIDCHKRSIKNAVHRALPTIDLPAKKLADLVH